MTHEMVITDVEIDRDCLLFSVEIDGATVGDGDEVVLTLVVNE